MSDGGPAFPVVINSDHEEHNNGMSLRDYFAGQVIQGMLKDRDNPNPEILSVLAYAMADAMLAQRTAGQEETK